MRLRAGKTQNKRLLAMVIGFTAFGSLAQAEETKTTDATIKAPAAQGTDDEMVEVYYNNMTAYPKRPRVELGSIEFVSPSQLHEVAGAHAAVGGQFKNVSLSESGNDTRTESMNFDARGMYGWKDYSVGLTLGYQDNSISPDNAIGIGNVERRALVAQPQFSASITRNVTLGLSGRIFSENYALDGSKDVNVSVDRDVNLTYGTATAGASYNDEKQEYGVTYTTEAKASKDISKTNETVNVYRAPVATIFARGNLSDAFSVFGTSSYTFYERANEANQGRDVYDRYDLRDRIGAKLGGVFWTNERSKFA